MNQTRLRLSNRLQKSLKRRSSRKRLIRYSLITANVAVLGIVVAFVVGSSHSAHFSAASALAASSTDAVNPVDGLTSYDIAANVARMTNLPESTAITNQAQSAQVAMAVSSSDTNVISKPQIVATALKSKDDIQTYTTQAGDTVTSIAQKFGVTSDSIKWSNNLSSDAVGLGTKLVIPPVNGIVYTVKAGDTLQSLATKYKADVNQITAYNDAEIAGIQPGEQVLIPNGQIQAVAAVAAPAFSSGGSFSLSSFTPLYGGNGYDFGYCTWYVATQVPVPANWGNANTWDNYAALSGWSVSSTPSVGAIAQTDAGYAGHVAVVRSVNGDGTVTVQEMNYTHWDVVDTRTAPVSSFRYITH